MKITMYDLLGLVKDGKAPKMIKLDDEIYELTSNKNDYYNKDYGYWFTNQICSLGALNDEVEIIEEEKKIPEKLPSICACNDFNENEEKLAKNINILKNKYNEIIDYLDYLKSKGE